MNIGDKVRYTAEFLRSIVDYSMDTASKFAAVTAIVELAPGFIIVETDEKGGLPAAINIKNLEVFK